MQKVSIDSVGVVYFLGIGGIGMSALARYFHLKGKTVLGYDRTPTALTTELEMEGIPIHFDDNVLEIPQLIRLTPKEDVLVVYTPAIPANSNELKWFTDNGFSLKKRSEVLGAITQHTTTIAVAGTHGKTTTSTLIAHILTHSGIGCNAFLGGISSNYSTNLLLDDTSNIVVVEADEFDRSFLTLHPSRSVITSMDADHLDIYGSEEYVRTGFNLFAQRIREGGILFCKQGLPLDREPLKTLCRVMTYTINDSADFRARDISVENGYYFFTFQSPDQKIENLCLGMPGRHNVENAVVACAVALEMGVKPEQLSRALASFKGVKRRFETHVHNEKTVYIDDYAHHPEELKACIQSVKELFPGKIVTGVFQPHLFTRTRDFADSFARSLDLLDEIILLPIYAARELPIAVIDSQMLLNKILNPHKKLVEKSELLSEVKKRRPEVLITLGAGDIDTLTEPLKKTLE
ncbi:MAG: UDP-N-acetylmuramate--L-alanine ligase [Crocinitomicaceae bacterium]|nr:UDP-N-acetylmuramate--L-alanine ligase [Crocinitomicaceae bacterium]